jgi:hypothetical protein
VRIAVDNRELQGQASSVAAEIAARVKGSVPGKGPPAPRKDGGSPNTGAASERPPGTYVAIPDRFYDVRSSGLTYTVKSGEQPFDILLK